MGVIKTVTANELRDIVNGSVVNKTMTGAGITLFTTNVPVIGAGYYLEMKPGLQKVLLDGVFPEKDMKAYFEHMNKKLRNFAEPWQAEVTENLNIGMFQNLIALNSCDETLNGLIVGSYTKMDGFKNFADVPTTDRKQLATYLRQIRKQVITLTERGIYQENIFKMPAENDSEEDQKPQINAVYNAKTGEANIYSMLGGTVTRKNDIAEYRRRLHDTYAGLGNLINYYAGHQIYDTSCYIDGDILDEMINHIDGRNK